GPCAGRLTLARGRGGERRDGDPVQSDLERSRGAPVATYRPDRSQPGPRVAGARDELDVCREPAAHRLDGEPDRGGAGGDARRADRLRGVRDRKSTRLNSSHEWISYAVFCLKNKTTSR